MEIIGPAGHFFKAERGDLFDGYLMARPGGRRSAWQPGLRHIVYQWVRGAETGLSYLMAV
jgi:hypothetical protein